MGPHSWNKTLAQITNLAPPVAALYEKTWRKRSLTKLSGRPFPLEEELAELAAAVHPVPGATFVDVACSEGLYARALAKQGATVFAVDHSVAFLKRVVKHSGDLPVIAVRAMAQHLPLQPRSVNGAVMGGSLNEIGNRQEAINEMARVIESSGSIFTMSLITALTKPGQLLQKLARITGIEAPSRTDTVQHFTNAGLVVEREALDRIVLRITAARNS
jgi:SAM-dependent methyltransferase